MKNLDLSWFESNNLEKNNIFGFSFNIVYNINYYDNETKLFGNNFVENNKYNCYLIIEGKKNDLCSSWKLDKNQRKKDTLQIVLIIMNPITDMSYMFSECNSLNNLQDISKWNTKNVTNMSYMFSECYSLDNLPDISKWDTKNVTNMSYMFYYCNSLKNLPDVS